ncbi:MAG: hypothetical protein IAE94_11565 [Chthoniobacterales bacterium]|nr:hypothetical protein [Chthoniobacterales bacterium]
MKIIDANAAFGFWPIQRFSTRTLEALDAVFARTDIAEVWLSAVESILYPEPDEWDLRLFRQLPAFPRFRPVKTVNPLLANWEKSWDAAKAFPLAAVKLFPNYHGYSPADRCVDAVCEKAVRENLPVLIQMRVNDERNQPSFLQVVGVSAADIAALSRRHPAARIVALCPYNSELSALAEGSNHLLADISFLDGAAILEGAVQLLSPARLVFGSHEPFLHADSSRLKLDHSKLPAEVLQKLASENLAKTNE